MVTHPLWNQEEGRALVERGLGRRMIRWKLWRVMCLTRKPSMTTSPRKNLPRTSLFFSVQINISGGRRQNLQQHVQVKQSNPLPNETNSHGLFFVEISVSQVTKTMQISAKLNHRFLSHCHSGDGGLRLNSCRRKTSLTGRADGLFIKFFVHF